MPAPLPSCIEIHPGLTMIGQLSMTRDIVLTGKFEGDLQTRGCLTVASGGVATGTLEVGALVLEPGNLVEARIKVSPPPPTTGKAAPRAPDEPVASRWTGGLRRLKEFAFGRK